MTIQEIITRQQQINVRMAELRAKAEDENTPMEELEQYRSESESLTKERASLETRKALLEGEIVNPTPASDPAQRSATGAADDDPDNIYGSMAYRKAFKDYITKRRMSPILRGEINDASSTTTKDNKAVIVPTTITNRIFKKNNLAGSLFQRVTKTSYPAGINIPYSNFKATLEWPGEKNTAQKKGAATDSVVFTGHKGQVKVAITLEMRTMSVEEFEDGLVEKIIEGCKEGFDVVIVSGDGSKKPKGIIPFANYEKKGVLMNNKQISDYGYWIQVYAKLKQNQKSRSLLHINASDWYNYILGMKDADGKVIALETMGFGGNLEPRFMGRPVVLLEDQGLKTFEEVTGNATASKDTAFAYFCADEDYIFNSNMQLVLREYTNEDTDEIVHKATIICDGQLVDDDSLLVVCRNVDATAEK